MANTKSKQLVFEDLVESVKKQSPQEKIQARLVYLEAAAETYSKYSTNQLESAYQEALRYYTSQ